MSMWMYIISMALQVSGALMILLFSISVKRKNVIKRFHGTGIIIQDGNNNELSYDENAFNEEFKKAYLSKISFVYIASGYILGVFGEVNNDRKFEIALYILVATFLIVVFSYFLLNGLLKQIVIYIKY